MKYDLRSNPCLVKVRCFLFKFVHIKQTGCYTMKRRQLKEIVICPKYLVGKLLLILATCLKKILSNWYLVLEHILYHISFFEIDKINIDIYYALDNLFPCILVCLRFNWRNANMHLEFKAFKSLWIIDVAEKISGRGWIIN